MNKQVPWLRIAIEAAAVVASILLAFAIDAWWERLGERAQEVEALEILARDLSATIEQVTEFQARVDATVSATLGAYTALSVEGGVEDESSVSAQLVTSHQRTTLRIPRAGYTDLLSTGTLRLVQSRSLRDSIVQFYETADRYEVIIEKNSTIYTDGHLGDVLIGKGLVNLVPRTTSGPAATIERDARIRDRLGDGFDHGLDPIWQLSADSRELDQLRSALLLSARGGQMALQLAERLIGDATAMMEAIEEYLRDGSDPL